jgi:hypothetical protein
MRSLKMKQIPHEKWGEKLINTLRELCTPIVLE